MFIELPGHDKIINCDSIDRFEIHTIPGNKGDKPLYRLVMYINHGYSNNHRNNSEGKVVLAKSLEKSRIQEILSKIVEKLGDSIITISTPLKGELC